MGCFVGISNRRDWWSMQDITLEKGAPFRLGRFMSKNRFEEILIALTYTQDAMPTYRDGFFWQRKMKEECNENMTRVFEPSWVSVLDESMQEWIDRFT